VEEENSARARVARLTTGHGWLLFTRPGGGCEQRVGCVAAIPACLPPILRADRFVRVHGGLSSTRVRVLVEGLALASLKHNVRGLVFVRSCPST
jgi:hypothetical protein